MQILTIITSPNDRVCYYTRESVSLSVFPGVTNEARVHYKGPLTELA